jgi:hypothetical protein
MYFVYKMSGSKVTQLLYSPKNKVNEERYVIKRIPHGLWLDMIFIQLVVCIRVFYPLAKAWG